LEFQKKQGCGWPKLQRPSQAGWAGAVKPSERSDENSIKIGPLPPTNSLRGVFLSVSSQLPIFTVVSLLSTSYSITSPFRLPQTITMKLSTAFPITLACISSCAAIEEYVRLSPIPRSSN
jgi:hypothetical protein